VWRLSTGPRHRRVGRILRVKAGGLVGRRDKEPRWVQGTRLRDWQPTTTGVKETSGFDPFEDRAAQLLRCLPRGLVEKLPLQGRVDQKDSIIELHRFPCR
jgi:hypothetical protein